MAKTIEVNVLFHTLSPMPDWLNKTKAKYLSLPHTYQVDEKAVMRDLLIIILLEIEPEKEFEWTDQYLYRRFLGIIDNQKRDINFDFPVLEFIKQNAVNGFILIDYQLAIRGGWGCPITAEVWLEMPSKENGHERIPHVHIRKGRFLKHESYKNTVRVNLTDLTIMDNAEKKVNKLFTKREWTFVMRVLAENREKLIKNYNDMLKGIMIESISLNLDEETYHTVPNMFKY